MMEHGSQGKHEAHRKLIARLDEQSQDIRRLSSGLDDEALSRRTVPGKWSLKELVCHIWRVQQVFESRVAAMLAEDNPAIQAYNPDGDTEFERMTSLPATELLEGFLSNRRELKARLEQLTPSDWHRKGRHPDFPHYDVHFQVEYMAHHEAHHIYQMFQRRSPLGKVPH
jgi:hypothetical protein